MNNEYRYCVS